MTNEEAIKELSNMWIVADDNFIRKSDAIRMAISAMEKQIPKKPRSTPYQNVSDDGVQRYSYTCPSCVHEVGGMTLINTMLLIDALLLWCMCRIGGRNDNDQ